MENKSAFTPEEEAVLEDVRKRGGFEALSAEDLDRITGGGSLGIKGIFDVDMSVYSPVYFSLAMGVAIAHKARGYTREQAIQAVYDFYLDNHHIRMNNLDKCITQEEWDKH